MINSNTNVETDKYTSCAWDVGIKTLSYCLIEFDKKNVDYWKILDLGQLNLLAENKHECDGLLNKSNTKCTSQAIFQGKNIEGKEFYYCGTHKSQYKSLYIPTNYFIQIVPETIEFKCDSMIGLKKCNKTSKYKNADATKTYCKAHMLCQTKKITKETSLMKIKKVTCASENLEQLGTTMYNKFTTKTNLFEATKIKIENQPTLKNPTMKSLSMLLFSYAIMQKMKENSNIKNINFIAPSSKLNTTIDVIVDIINQSLPTDKLMNLLVKLLTQTNNTITVQDYKTYFGDNFNLFLSTVVMRTLNKKYEISEEFIQLLESKKQESINAIGEQCTKKLITKEIIIDLLDKIHEKKENKLIYDITKALSIKYAIIILIKTNQKQWADFICAHKKCDDFTDAVLLCLKSNECKKKIKF